MTQTAALALRAAGWGALLVVWWGLVRSGVVPPAFAADPLETLGALVAGLVRGALLRDAGATLLRAVAGLVVGAAVAVPAGLVAGAWPTLHEALRGPTDLLRSIPPVLLFPLALLALGPGEPARLAVIALGTGTVLYLHAARGAAACPAELIEPLRALGATRWQLLRWAIVPGAVPSLAAGLRVSLSLALVIALVTEMLVGARAGLGARAVELQLAYRTPDLFAVLLLVGVLGWGGNGALAAVERRFVRWSHAEGRVR